MCIQLCSLAKFRPSSSLTWATRELLTWLQWTPRNSQPQIQCDHIVHNWNLSMISPSMKKACSLGKDYARALSNWAPDLSISHPVLEASTLFSQGQQNLPPPLPDLLSLSPHSLLRLSSSPFPRMLLPRGLCTRLFLYLDQGPLKEPRTQGSLHFPWALHKCHLAERSSLATLSKITPLPLTPHLISLPLFYFPRSTNLWSPGTWYPCLPTLEQRLHDTKDFARFVLCTISVHITVPTTHIVASQWILIEWIKWTNGIPFCLLIPTLCAATCLPIFEHVVPFTWDALPPIPLARLTCRFCLKPPSLGNSTCLPTLNPDLVRVPILCPLPAPVIALECHCWYALLSPLGHADLHSRKVCWFCYVSEMPSEGLAHSRYFINGYWFNKQMIIILDIYWALAICLSLF